MVDRDNPEAWTAIIGRIHDSVMEVDTNPTIETFAWLTHLTREAMRLQGIEPEEVADRSAHNTAHETSRRQRIIQELGLGAVLAEPTEQ